MKFSANTKTSKIAVALFFAGVMLVCGQLCSCSNEETAYSFSSKIDEVDVLIRNHQVGEALSLLRKAERCASNPDSRLSLFKRYKTLGEKSLCEKTLRKAAKKFPDSIQIAAVYSDFLLRNDRIVEAEKSSRILSGTKYGSIHSEAVLKKNSSGTLSTYLSLNFAKVYEDIFASSTNSNRNWLVNAALVYLANGDYSRASYLQDYILKTNGKIPSKEALFWAFVQFDAGNYDLCIRNAKLVSVSGFKATAAALASDSYRKLNDDEEAEKVREYIISLGDEEVPDTVAVNSAIWAYNHKEYARAYRLLKGVLDENPECQPALLTYGKISWLDSLPVPESDLEKTVRETTTLRTSYMKEKDERPRFLVTDAISMISSVEEKYQKEQRENRNDSNIIDKIDSLIVERLSLFLRTNSELPINARTSEIWRTLEANESGVNLYPSKLVCFAVQKLISYGFPDDAHRLFMDFVNAKYMNSSNDAAAERYSENAEVNESGERVEIDIFGGERVVKADAVPESVVRLAFGEEVAKSASSMNIWEVELAAYFALVDGNIETAKKLYEYVLFESGEVVNSTVGDYNSSFENISSVASSSSAVNLAMIYSSFGDKDAALSLYGLASGKCENVFVKSKILHRIAKIQLERNDLRNAKISIDYSLALDPQNADALLIKRQCVDME
ncbi:MAG: hypothetical protein IJ673_04565 [Treponema sp.]|nr:hypothetical protein [Treponema sp.]